jgi:hypothetical protein
VAYCPLVSVALYTYIYILQETSSVKSVNLSVIIVIYDSLLLTFRFVIIMRLMNSHGHVDRGWPRGWVGGGGVHSCRKQLPMLENGF